MDENMIKDFFSKPMMKMRLITYMLRELEEKFIGDIALKQLPNEIHKKRITKALEEIIEKVNEI